MVISEKWDSNREDDVQKARFVKDKVLDESIQWLSEDSSRVALHRDNEVAKERIKCLKKYFTDAEDRKIVTLEFANFSSMSGDFSDSDSIEHRYGMDPKS
ncbi:hypothetical protein OROGR_011336 [Orobanche gracilis]